MSSALLIVQPSGVSAFNRVNPFFCFIHCFCASCCGSSVCSCSISILSQNMENSNNIMRGLCFIKSLVHRVRAAPVRTFPGFVCFVKSAGRSLCPLIRRVRAFISLPGKLSAMPFKSPCAPSCAVSAAFLIGSSCCRVFFCAVRQRDCRAGSPRVPLPVCKRQLSLYRRSGSS